MILLIDNYDSFTYNLYQHLSELGAAVRVRRNDEVTPREIARWKPSKIVLSPGPGRPEHAGALVEIITAFAARIPLLGVCLGHQAMAQAFGGSVVRATRPMHGKTSSIRHDGQGVYQGMSNPFTAARYHSLVVDRKSLSSDVIVTAELKDGTVMGLRHKHLLAEGVQFHPESISTQEGKSLLSNFLNRFP